MNGSEKCSPLGGSGWTLAFTGLAFVSSLTGLVRGDEAVATGGGLRRLNTVEQPADYRAKWGVIIGIDAYSGGVSQLGRLNHAVNDAREIHSLLRDEFGYPEEHLLFLADQDASKERMAEAVTEWLPARAVEATDSVLFFFAGHGLIDPQSNAGYLAGIDGSTGNLAESCVEVEWLRDRLADLPCRHKAVILDCCYSGTLFHRIEQSQSELAVVKGSEEASGSRGATEETAEVRGKLSSAPATATLSYYMREPAFLGLSAGRLTPVADGLGAERHSIFTAELLRSLRERADSPRSDHAFTFRRVASQVEQRVASALGSRQIPESGRLGLGDGDFVFRPTIRRKTPTELSEERRATAHERLVGIHLANGVKPMLDGDLLGSLPHLAEAAILDQNNPERSRAHRIRLKSILARSPRLLQLWVHEGAINDIDFSPGGQRVVTGSADFTARVWDVKTGSAVTPPLEHRDPVLKVAFSPDATRVVTSCGDTSGRNGKGAVRVWDAETGMPITPWLEHDGMDRPKERQKPTDYIRTNAGVVLDVCFNATGDLVASASDSQEVRVWDSATGVLRYGPFMHHSAANVCAFAPDGERLLTAATDGVQLWDLESGKIQHGPWKRDSKLDPVRFHSPRGLVVLIEDGAAHVYQVTSGESISAAIADGNRVADVEFDPRGRRLLIGSDDGSVRVWDLQRKRWSSPRTAPEPQLTSVGFRQDGRVFFTAGTNVRLWDSETCRAVCPAMPGSAAAFSPTGRISSQSTVTGPCYGKYRLSNRFD